MVAKLVAATCNANIPVIDFSTALSLATHNGHSRIVTMIHITSSIRAPSASSMDTTPNIRAADSHNLLNPCTVCKKHGHDAKHVGCWFNAENKLREAAKMKSDAEAILKSGWFCRNRLVLQLRFSEMLSCLRRLVCHAAFTISCSLCRP